MQTCIMRLCVPMAASVACLFIVKIATATSITYTNFFLEERVNVGSTSGTSLQIEAGVSDPLGVPSNISQVTAFHVGSPGAFSLPYRGIGNFTTPTFGPYFTNPLYNATPTSLRTGQYQIFVTNDQGETASAVTQHLTATNPLAHAQNINISGPALTPAVSWSRVPGADRYEIRINDSSGRLIYDTPYQLASTFSVPAGILSGSQNYQIGLFSVDFDSSANLERRSLTFQNYSTIAPPSPPPSSAPPTLLQLAQSAQASYGDNASIPVGYTEISAIRNIPHVAAGFSARAFRNSDGTQVILAITGSDQLSDWIGPNPSFINPLGPTNDFRSYVQDAANAMSYLQIQFPAAQINITGHSLGGALAQLLGEASKSRTVTFDAPGAKQTLSDQGISSSLRGRFERG